MPDLLLLVKSHRFGGDLMEKLLGTREIAEILGKSEWWVRSNPPPVGPPRRKVGCEWRFSPDEVARWINTLPSE